MVPSARARVRQYIQPLESLGIAVREYPLPWSNILPRQATLRPLWMAATAAARVAALARSWRADVTWVSRQFLPAFAPLHGLARRPMILDVDDAIWLNTGGHRARNLARASDLVVCGNSFLANHFSRWNRNITVIPTAVNTSWYRPNSARVEGGPLYLGWTGTSGNFPFLYTIERCAHEGVCSIAAATPETAHRRRYGHPNSSCLRTHSRVRVRILGPHDSELSRLRAHVHRVDAARRHRLVQRQVQLQNVVLHGCGAASRCEPQRE